ncbi:hypothetical protein DXG01_005266 [Tephrocybe rancida]|nr:hypothetical protein DXG01_005266 [Tephrocybe rancida]
MLSPVRIKRAWWSLPAESSGRLVAFFPTTPNPPPHWHRDQCQQSFESPTTPSRPSVIQADPRRKPFRNHAFNSCFPDPHIDKCIYDACTGQHLGTETIQQYLSNSIDEIHPPPLAGNAATGKGVEALSTRRQLAATAPTVSPPHLAYDAVASTSGIAALVDEDGRLDVAQSAAAAGEHAENLPMSTQFADAWTSGKLPISERIFDAAMI